MNNDWIDPDDAPHLDTAWFAKAEIKRGDEVLRDKDDWIPWSGGPCPFAVPTILNIRCAGEMRDDGQGS